MVMIPNDYPYFNGHANRVQESGHKTESGTVFEFYAIDKIAKAKTQPKKEEPKSDHVKDILTESMNKLIAHKKTTPELKKRAQKILDKMNAKEKNESKPIGGKKEEKKEEAQKKVEIKITH